MKKAIVDETNSSVKIYTDGSKTSDGDTSAAFVVPELKVSSVFNVPKHVSVFINSNSRGIVVGCGFSTFSSYHFHSLSKNSTWFVACQESFT